MAIQGYLTEQSLDREVIFHMYQHKGRENRIERWELVRKVFGNEAAPTKAEETDGNVYDRQVRDSLERLRRARPSHLICNLGDGKGYFISQTREEYETWKKYYLGSSFLKLQIVSMTDDAADLKFGKEPKDADPLPLFEGMGG